MVEYSIMRTLSSLVSALLAIFKSTLFNWRSICSFSNWAEWIWSSHLDISVSSSVFWACNSFISLSSLTVSFFSALLLRCTSNCSSAVITFSFSETILSASVDILVISSLMNFSIRDLAKGVIALTASEPISLSSFLSWAFTSIERVLYESVEAE